jgi:ABC-type hemin transport system ATPase subunit
LKSEQPRQSIALETAHLSRAVAGKILTDDINVQVQVGEVVAVVGPSEMENRAKRSSPFLLQTRRLSGASVFHCHVVKHEDKGHDDDC